MKFMASRSMFAMICMHMVFVCMQQYDGHDYFLLLKRNIDHNKLH